MRLSTVSMAATRFCRVIGSLASGFTSPAVLATVSVCKSGAGESPETSIATLATHGAYYLGHFPEGQLFMVVQAEYRLLDIRHFLDGVGEKLSPVPTAPATLMAISRRCRKYTGASPCRRLLERRFPDFRD